jgi:hypothetical protein
MPVVNTYAWVISRGLIFAPLNNCRAYVVKIAKGETGDPKDSEKDVVVASFRL